jgi:aspartate/methionine/tyrosine aminotransferase
VIQVADRLQDVQEYYFSKKLREIDEMNRSGEKVINLGIGSPDLPPHPDVVDVLHTESSKPHTHAYQSYKGAPALRQAMADWYAGWYRVLLNPDTEILPLIGSKEGITHICMTYLNEGDAALVPNPGYPAYASAVKVAGGIGLPFSLKEENNYLPDFTELTRLVKNNGKVKLLFINYPNMPTGQLPTRELFDDLVKWAALNKVLIVHEDKVFGGFGGEIAALIAENCFEHLDAPIMRIGSTDTPVGFSKHLEEFTLPNAEKVFQAALKLSQY